MLLLLVTFTPILAAILIMVGLPARLTAMAASVLTLLVGAIIFLRFNVASGFQFVVTFPISPELRLNFALGVDGLSLLMILLGAIVLVAAVWVTGEIEHHENAFYACLLLIAGGAIGAFASLNLFFFYAFHELALIPTFLLIGIWGSGNRRAAAWKVTIYLALGSIILLVGLIMLYRAVPVSARSLDLRILHAGQIPASLQSNIYLVLLIGFGILISLVPFHTWAPEAYACAPAPAAMLHAGVLKKFGLYGLLRLALPLLPDGARQWSGILLVLLLGNIIYIGLVTIAQRRLDWMLGYSSVMHMGYIFLGIASANILGTTGAAILMFAHGLSIALLFGITGEIRKCVPSLDFDAMGGLAKAMPLAAFAFGLGVFAAIGLPGFANFAAEIMVIFGAFQNGFDYQHFHVFQWATLLALWGVVISAVYMLRAYRRTFFGSSPESELVITDIRSGFRVPIALLVAVSLLLGFFPQIAVNRLVPTFRNYFSATQ
ncbi:MAG TPA: NADH-quinone oxidoreductase subunit M [Chthoniobacterales bacterium]|nr:NADH-quinone oxidoreductase subunit M [Chthoniobacterales bacterium]